MSLMNFVDRTIPVVSAAWLNAIDTIKYTIFADATTKAAARTALTSDAPLEVGNGGTGQRTPLLTSTTDPTFTSVTATAGVSAASFTASGAVSGATAAITGTASVGGANVTANAVPTNGLYLKAAGTPAVSAGSTETAEFPTTGSKVYEPNFGAAALRNVATYETGSFTGTLTGVSGTVTGTVNYTRVGNIVYINVPNPITGTSNAITMTLTGLPSAINPASAVGAASGYHATDNNIGKWATVIVGSNKFTFGLWVVTGTYVGDDPNGWTSSGTKGIPSGSWVYMLP